MIDPITKEFKEYFCFGCGQIRMCDRGLSLIPGKLCYNCGSKELLWGDVGELKAEFAKEEDK